MKVGLVGFAGSGKTTVFNPMTSLHVPTGFGGEVHLGAVKVPDERIDALSKIFKPSGRSPATRRTVVSSQRHTLVKRLLNE